MKYLNSILFSLLYLPVAYSQFPEYYQRKIEEYLESERYTPALGLLLEYDSLYPQEALTLMQVGVCYYHLNRLPQAKDYLYRSFHARGNPPADTYRYLAKVHHSELDFEEAIRLYKQFLRITNDYHPLRASVKDEILRCANGLHAVRVPPEIAVVNLGEIINSPDDEFQPLPSPTNGERLYFSSARPGNAGCDLALADSIFSTERQVCKTDMFYSEIVAGDWAAPKRVSVFLNSVEHEVALDFDENGERLFFFRGKTLFSGDVLVDTFQEDVTLRTLFFTNFESPMRPWEGDCAPFFFYDTILLFASRRPGGFGGLDLYVTTFSGNHWTAPQNLGNVINSPYDETSPFLAADGRTLYFSTNDARRSIGGLDVFRSIYLDQTLRWSPPENLGVPINSAGDDDHFRLSANGLKAIFDSSRKEGLGARDLYVALFEQELAEQQKRSIPVSFHLVRKHREVASAASEVGLVPQNAYEPGAVLEIKPMRYETPGDTLSGENLRQLHLMTELVKRCPQAKIIFSLHCDPSDSPMLSGEPLLNQAFRYLKSQATPLDNLVFLNAGSAFPVADSERFPAKKHLNRRIELLISNPEAIPFEVRMPALPVAKEEAAGGGSFFKKALNSLCYQVSVPVSDAAILETLYRLFPRGIVGKKAASETMLFSTGIYLTWQTATEWRKDLESKGFPAASITPLLHGWEVSKEEARQRVQQYPDLEYFGRN
jgi:hypothetical protein